jgi:hypothetical protein
LDEDVLPSLFFLLFFLGASSSTDTSVATVDSVVSVASTTDFFGLAMMTIPPLNKIM